MVGKVVAVHVKVGSVVKENDPVVTIESMKMELPVPAPVGGTIKEVFVKEGDVVESDTAIVTIE
jgi:biotin carboxyl carrier protein